MRRLRIEEQARKSNQAVESGPRSRCGMEIELGRRERTEERMRHGNGLGRRKIYVAQVNRPEVYAGGRALLDLQVAGGTEFDEGTGAAAPDDRLLYG